MKQLLAFLLIAFLLLPCTKTNGQNSKLRSSEEPSWITNNTIDYNNTKLEEDAEDGYMDLRFEKQVSLSQQSRFYKKTLKILSEAGVQNSSEISVNFDPAYEQLTFHVIRIIRDGKSLNKLQLSNFKIIQQEKELSKHMYDGSLTALLVLDDVRKGDIIEYSYSIRGFNPIFNNKYADVYDCRYGVPIANLFYKLMIPANRNVIIKNRQTTITPAISKVNNETMYEWKLTNIPALYVENKTPGWYDPFGSIIISEFQSWNEVSRWASALFPRDIKLSPELQAKINSIKKTCNDDETRVLSALRFVQDDIRYMAVETGINSHKPNNPNKIFVQRFGDCKDKSYLLTTMLYAMGIEAYPVLINTVDKKTVNEMLPSALAFDHCTVQVKVNGKTYWFDPTISFQRGSINDIAYPDYQTGLVVNESNTGLSSIPFHDSGLNDIKEIINVPDKFGTASLKVITRFTGSFADDARSNFNNNSLSEIKNKYKDFYAGYFDKITVDSLQYKNDDITGAFTTTEYYTIKNIWTNEDGKDKISLSSYIIEGALSKPADKNRTMPFRLTYPAHFKEQVEINMPEDWPISNFNDRVSCASFNLTANGRSEGNKVILNYEYENLKDNVMPGETASFFSRYDEAFKDIGYELYYDDAKTSSNSLARTSTSLPDMGLFPKLYMSLGLCVLITFLIKRKRTGSMNR